MAATIDQTQALLAPDIAAQQMMLDRRQQMADLLRQQSLQEQQGQMIGNAYVAPSWTQGLAKMAQALIASKSQDNIDAQRLDLAKQYQGKLAEQLDDANGPAVAGTTGPTLTNAARMDANGGDDTAALTPVNASGAPRIDLAAALRGRAIEALGGSGASNVYWDRFKPTEFQKEVSLLPAAQQSAAIQQKLLPPIVGRAGAVLFKTGTDGRTIIDPASLEAITKVKDAQAPYEPMRTLKTDNGQEYQVTEPEYLAWQKTQKLPARLLPQGVAESAQVNANATGSPQSINVATPGLGSISTVVQPRVGVSQSTEGKAAAEAAGKNREDEFSKSWTSLQEANRTAQTTNSYLQSIKELAKKANAGSASDKWAFVNGILAPFGNDRANDELTAKNLLDKYSNQITARLGSGGMGTDAARSILQSAYPNSHMQPDAINEAVDNLVGANEMVKAKTRFLEKHALNRDAKSYSANEIQFDQNADPRVWQLKTMPAESQAAFVKKMEPSVAADLLKRIQTLKKIGAY